MQLPGALGPSVWVASDGRAGNEAQVVALSRAMGEMSRWMQIAHVKGEAHRGQPMRLKPSGLQLLLPPDKWPAPFAALPKDQRDAFKPPYPSVFIGAGRRTAPYTRALKKLSGGETFCVQILDPRIDPTAFDLVVAPEHDGLTGENVITTLGSPSYFAPEDIEEVELHFADMAEEGGFRVAVSLGGDSNTHNMTEAACERLETNFRQLAGKGARLRMTCSRRTPTHARVRFRAMAEDIGARFWESPADGLNPYLANLLFSDAAIVTEDSANMMSDAAYFGLPIHLARLEGRSDKFDRLHQSFIDRGAARWLERDPQVWSYEPIREVDRVADRLVAELAARHEAPDIDGFEGPREIFPDRR